MDSFDSRQCARQLFNLVVVAELTKLVHLPLIHCWVSVWQLLLLHSFSHTQRLLSNDMVVTLTNMRILLQLYFNRTAATTAEVKLSPGKGKQEEGQEQAGGKEQML